MSFSDFLRNEGCFSEKIVSRETIQRLELYDSLLKKWNAAYNLVETGTLDDSIHRHFLDSMQLYKLVDCAKSLIDLGSGAGFPGMVLAILGVSNTTLVESNRKKCLFMQEVSRQTSTSVQILNQRVEQITEKYDQVTSRAFASLSQLLEIFKNVSRETNSSGYFLKGERWEEEIELCEDEGWIFSYQATPSLTQERAAIIKVWDVNKK